MVLSRSSCFGFAGHHPHRGGAGACADHRGEELAAFVLCAVGFIDKVVDRLCGLLADLRLDWRELHLLRHTGRGDSPRLLPHCSLVPARLLPVVTAYVKGIIDRDGPNPGWGTVGLPVLAEWRDVQVVGPSNLAQFVFRPGGHRDLLN